MTTATPPYIDHFAYTSDDTSDERNSRLAAQRQLYSDPRFTTPSINEVEMLLPLFTRIEHELDIQIIIAACDSMETCSPNDLRSVLNPDSYPKPVVLFARHAYFHGNRDTATHSDASRYPALQSRAYETHTEYPDWTLSHGTIAGKLAPNIITAPWWWQTRTTTAEQLESFYTHFKGACELSLDPDTCNRLEEMRLAQLHERAASLIAARSSSEIEDLKRSVPLLLTEIVDAEQSIKRSETRLTEVRAQLSALEDANVLDEDISTVTARELTLIANHPLVTDIKAGDRPNKLDIYTRDIHITNPATDQTVIVGAYRISITFGSSPSLRVRNLTRRLGNYDHPHVSDGAFCLGDQRRLLDELISRSELSAAVSLTLDLLSQLNPNDTYTSDWEAWFQLPEGDGLDG